MDTYKIYLAGFAYGLVQFENQSITHCHFDFQTGQATPMGLYSPEDMFCYVAPLDAIWAEIQAFDCNCTAQTTVSELGITYNKLRTYQGQVDGIEKIATHWASRGNRPVGDIIVCDGQVIGYLAMFRQVNYFIKPGYEHLTPLQVWQEPALSKADYEVECLGKQWATMRDGVQLSCYVCKPKTDKPVPCILLRTPYGVDDNIGTVLPYVERGYGIVCQNIRGREDSQGEWNPQYHERFDGDDTLNWIAAQPWSDGSVGMIGCSYQGFVQWHAASTGNPHLKAMVSQVPVGSALRDIPRKGGTCTSGTFAWGFAMKDAHVDFRNTERDDWDTLLKHRPINEISKIALGHDIPFLKKWMETEPHDPFWQAMDWTQHADLVDVPTLHISGWYDDDGEGTSEAWETMAANKRKHQKMILGPWLHVFNSTRDINGIAYGNNAVLMELETLYLKWFDHYLKGMDNGIDQDCFVEYYQVGENQWKRSAQWPPENSQLVNYYLHSQGNANTSGGDGALSTVCCDKQSTTQYRFDPLDPAPYLIDIEQNEMATPNDYQEVELREDVLVFTSPVLEEEVSIAGTICAEVYLASDAPDTDFLVRVTDVTPDGQSLRLADGLIRAKYRTGFDAPRLLNAGEVNLYSIALSSIANTFQKGHRIRVEITSGAENLTFANHNTGLNPGFDTTFFTATQTLYLGGDYPSCVKLPVIK